MSVQKDAYKERQLNLTNVKFTLWF